MSDQLIIEEQHPIPQQISSFQFHLVGDMTLKQFLQVAAGALIALGIYSTNLAPAIKWPLILLSFGAGAAFAFLPLEDRPLAQWIFSFLRSIYSPTVFGWQKSQVPLQLFQPEGTAPPPQTQPQVAKMQAPVAKPVPSAAPLKPEETELEKKEKTFLSRISSLSHTQTTKATPTAASDIKMGVSVPSTQKVAVEKSKKPIIPEEKRTTPSVKPTFKQVDPILAQQQKLTGKQAQFSPEAAPPSPPTRANTIVGQVLNKKGKIIEGAILEIKDSSGRPARALKTNKLGHFMIVTPLLDGKYEITTEKEGYEFEPITFETKGEIIPPIAILTKGKKENIK